VGSNQYRERWGPDLPAPDRGLAVPEDPPERRRCGEIWGTGCRAWVGPPDWSHGNHPAKEARWAVAQHPGCPPQALEWLAEDPMAWVRGGVARNPQSPPQLLQLLARDPEWRVRRAVAGNPACPPQVLRALARDRDEQVRVAALANPACPQHWRALGQL